MSCCPICVPIRGYNLKHKMITKNSTEIAKYLTHVSSQKLRENENCLSKHTLVNNMLNDLYMKFPLSYLKAAALVDPNLDVKFYLKQLIDTGFATPEKLAMESRCLNLDD